MKRKVDIHNYKLRLERSIRQIENSDLSEKNKKLILDFKTHCSLEGLSIGRQERYLGVLKYWSELIGKDFDDADKSDLMRAVGIVQDRDISPWTKMTYKAMIKCFYKWLKQTGENYPDEVDFIKSRVKRTEISMPSEGQLITEEEIKKLIDTAVHPRDKAFVSVLYESGARVGEMATIQFKNVRMDKHGMVIMVQGKTGARPIRLISSVPLLTIWMNCHPLRDDEEAPIWISHSTNCKGNVLGYNGIQSMLKGLFERAGVKKRCNPHFFRHSRATYLANHLTEFQMNQYFGWIQGSKMASTYVHMSGKKIDQSMLKLNGVAIDDEKETSILKPIICERCDTINNNDSKFCSKCGLVLDLKKSYDLAKEQEEETKFRESSDDLMNMLFKDKDVLEMVSRKIKEMGMSERVIG